MVICLWLSCLWLSCLWLSAYGCPAYGYLPMAVLPMAVCLWLSCLWLSACICVYVCMYSLWLVGLVWKETMAWELFHQLSLQLYRSHSSRQHIPADPTTLSFLPFALLLFLSVLTEFSIVFLLLLSFFTLLLCIAAISTLFSAVSYVLYFINFILTSYSLRTMHFY